MTPLLTIAEVAEWLRVSRTTVYQLVDSGVLVAHRIGAGRGALRVSEDDLEDYLARVRQEKPTAASAPKPPARRLRHLRL